MKAADAMFAIRPMVFAVALTSASWASAQARDPAAADALFREARSLMKEGKYTVACPKLAESQRLDPAAGTLINLGDCFQKTGQLANALQAMRDALDMLAPTDSRVAPVKEEMAALDKRVPRLTIRLAPDTPEDAKVLRDDVEYGAASLGVPIPVNPGDHMIVVAAPRRAKKAYPVTISEGQAREITVTVGKVLPDGASAEELELAPPPPEGSPPPRAVAPDTSTAPDSSRTIGWILGGVGVVGLGTGIVTGLMLDERQSTVDANCDSKTKLCNDEGYSAAQDGKTLRTVSFVGWGIGLAGIAAGGYFLFLAGPSKAPTTAVNGVASRDGAFFSVSRRF